MFFVETDEVENKGWRDRMIDDSDNLILPQEIECYIASLEKVYSHKKQNILQSILVNAKIKIEQTSYDRWDGGRYGFTLRLMIPDAIFVNVIEDKEKYEKQIRQDISSLIAINGECIESVSIEMELISDENWREKSGLVLHTKKHISKNVLERIWKPIYIRAFLSHKVTHKTEAGDLKETLEKYGISCFVAHKDIKPTKEWVQEIENALFSMEILISLMTEDFHDSEWTDQEVGVAIGRHVLIIPVKMGKDPYGFIGKYQALSAKRENIPKIAKGILEIILEHPSTKERIKRAAIHAFKESPNFYSSKYFVTDIFPTFEKMKKSEIDDIIEAFNKNNQIYDCFVAKTKLPDLFYKWTGERYHIIEKELVKESQINSSTADDIPF